MHQPAHQKGTFQRFGFSHLPSFPTCLYFAGDEKARTETGRAQDWLQLKRWCCALGKESFKGFIPKTLSNWYIQCNLAGSSLPLTCFFQPYTKSFIYKIRGIFPMKAHVGYTPKRTHFILLLLIPGTLFARTDCPFPLTSGLSLLWFVPKIPASTRSSFSTTHFHPKPQPFLFFFLLNYSCF